MIAELHGKISSSGSNLHERLEDNLTGDVFGALRYLPFELSLGPLLRASRLPGLAEVLDGEHIDDWGERIQFWPRRNDGESVVELDALITLDQAVIGVEVKYRSPLSGDDEVDNSRPESGQDGKESFNQLAREARVVHSEADSDKKGFLLFVADDKACAPVFADVMGRKLIKSETQVELGYISWQEVLITLTEIKAAQAYQRLVLADIISLLRKKGFERFKSFDAMAEMPLICSDCFFSYHYQAANEFSFSDTENIDGGAYYEYR